MKADSNVTISPASAAECDEIAALVNSAYRGDSSRQGWTTEADYLKGQRADAIGLRHEIAKPRHWIYALRAGGQPDIKACVQLNIGENGDVYFGMLTVRPDLQDRGYGRRLLEHVESVAVQNGSGRVFMGVIHIRDTLIAWYERRGYRRTGETKPFPYGRSEFGEPLRDDLYFVFLEKRLSPSA